MFLVTVQINIKEGAWDSFMPLMLENARTSRAIEPGCLRFDIASDPARPNEVFLYELYKNAAAFDDHLAAAHFKSFDAATANLIVDKCVRTYSRIMQ